MNKLSQLAKPAIVPPLHQRFAPAALANRAFLRMVDESGEGVPLSIALLRGDGSISTFHTKCFNEASCNADLNLPFAERIIKFLLWQRGGWKVIVGGPKSIGEHIKNVYSAAGARKFDAEFMGGVYEHPFTVEITDADKIPTSSEGTVPLGGHLDGCRIGFDLGAM